MAATASIVLELLSINALTLELSTIVNLNVLCSSD